MNKVENLFPELVEINHDDVQIGDWIMFDSSRGLVVHRVISVQINSGIYDIKLFNESEGPQTDILDAVGMYLVKSEPVLYDVTVGSLMMVTTEKFTLETLVVRSPGEYWIVIDKRYPDNFTETVYDNEVITFRELDEDGIVLDPDN